ncbi:uncharacterized protein isoform X2 [Rhodnius prolixus]|uniref:uncharacterized protein isoform X2 n=1 Tax=Rhodnius prolixus TaxID=13249 RepID=UPI003D18C6D5
MLGANLVRTPQGLNMQYAEQSRSASTDWESTLHEPSNPINNFQEKEIECLYYPYSSVLNSLSAQEHSWSTTSCSQNAGHNQDQEGKKKNQQEIEQQHQAVSSGESQKVKLGCPIVSTYHDFGSYSSYFHDRSDADVLKQQQNCSIISDCDLTKLSDFAPDIINLEGSVGSDLLKVVDSEEEDLVVDDSETESEISISDTSSLPTQYERHCMVCGLPQSHTVEANFLHVDSTYPLTYVSKTPVIVKLVEIIPSDMHSRLNIGHSIICRRCFNLIDTAENLELRLITVKQELCDFVARTQATAPLVEGSKPNLTSFRQYGSHEVPTYSAAIMSAKPTTLQLAEYQRHIAANCGLSENLYLTSHGPSYFYRNTFTDKCFLEVENCAQSKSVNTVCPSPNSLPTDCSSKCNLGYSQFGIALPTEKENQCSQTYLNSPSDTVSNSESNLRTSQEEICKVEATEKKSSVEEIITEEIVTVGEENSEKKIKRVFKSRGSFQCDRCGRTYCQKFKLMNHLKKHYDDFRFKCEHCSKGYSTERHLVLHLRCHNDVRPYVCERCPASFLKAEQLKSHLLFCIDKMYSCNSCSKVFVSSEKLGEHLKSRVSKDSCNSKIKKLECEICHKRFRYPTDLINHLSSHNDDKSYRCNICGKSYKHKRHLNRHHRVSHLKGQEEKNMDNLDELVDNITSEQDCKQQPDINILNEELKSERKTSQKKRMCPICNKVVWKLKTHMISHSNIKGFSCSLCNVQFTLKQGLVRHMRNKHAAEESNKIS